MIRLLTIVLFVEVGLVLAVMPWSTFWERNYFADLVPLLHMVITNDFFRGAVSGLGLINLAAAFVEVRSLLGGRRLESSMGPLGDSSAVEE